MKKPKYDLVFLFDVDDTLLNNDRVQGDLYHHLFRNYGLVPASSAITSIIANARFAIIFMTSLFFLGSVKMHISHCGTEGKP